MIIFITSKIKVGGAEIYLYKLSSSLKKMGIKVKLLVLHSKIEDEVLYRKFLDVSEVIFFKELLFFNAFNSIDKLSLLFPLSKKKIITRLNGAKSITVISGPSFFIARRLLKFLKVKNMIYILPHSLELSGGNPKSLPVHEKILRKNVSDSKVFVIFDSSKDLELHKEKYKDSLPLNVLFLKLGLEKKKYIKCKHLTKKVGILGKLETHKKYFRGVIESLKRNNLSLEIIGSGPIEKSLLHQAKELGLENRITFHGNLFDNKLEKVLEELDFVVASGTSLTLCASYGLPCLIGIENQRDITIGFFSDGDNLNYTDGDTKGKKTESFDFYMKEFYKHPKNYIDEAKILREEILGDRSIENYAKKFLKFTQLKNDVGYSQSFYIWIFFFFISKCFYYFNKKDFYEERFR